mgnify:CR=1 FL=1
MWQEKLTWLFSCLAQDPIEDAIDLMDIEGTKEEIRSWIEIIDAGIQASERGETSVLDIINRYQGYKISEPIEARAYFHEIGYLYLKRMIKE